MAFKELYFIIFFFKISILLVLLKHHKIKGYNPSLYWLHGEGRQSVLTNGEKIVFVSTGTELQTHYI